MKRMFFALCSLILLTGCQEHIEHLKGDTDSLLDVDAYLQDQNVEGCEHLSRLASYECIAEKALAEKDLDLCEKIVHTGLRLLCVKKLAIQECDTEICRTIEDRWKESACMRQLAASGCI